MRQLIMMLTETKNTLFPVVNFLKCVVTAVVLFSIVAYYKCSPDSDSEISLKIDQYLIKLRRMKLMRTKKCASFLGHLNVN